MSKQTISRMILAIAGAIVLLTPLAYAEHGDQMNSDYNVSAGGAISVSSDNGTGNAFSSSNQTQGAITSSAANGVSLPQDSPTIDQSSQDSNVFKQVFGGKDLKQVEDSLTSTNPQGAEQAIQLADSILSQNPSNDQALQALGVAEATYGETQQATSTLEQAVALNPNAQDATYQTLGNLLTEEGDKGIKLIADGKPVDFAPYGQSPIIVNGRSLAPVSAIANALGAQVGWDPSTQTVTLTQGQNTIQMQIGSSVAYINGQPMVMDVPAEIKHDRTMLPIRYIAQMLGLQVHWYASSKLVSLIPGTSSGNSTVTGAVYGTH